MTLYQLSKEKRCVIEKCPMIKLLQSLGLREGIPVSITSKQPFGGPIVVKIGNRNIAVAKDIAQEIVVREIV